MKIDWRKQMMEFLKYHGWKEIKKGLIEHPLFPFLEDVSSDISLSIFVKDFYTEAWGSYQNLIEFYVRKENKK